MEPSDVQPYTSERLQRYFERAHYLKKLRGDPYSLSWGIIETGPPPQGVVIVGNPPPGALDDFYESLKGQPGRPISFVETLSQVYSPVPEDASHTAGAVSLPQPPYPLVMAETTDRRPPTQRNVLRVPPLLPSGDTLAYALRPLMYRGQTIIADEVFTLRGYPEDAIFLQLGYIARLPPEHRPYRHLPTDRHFFRRWPHDLFRFVQDFSAPPGDVLTRGERMTPEHPAFGWLIGDYQVSPSPLMIPENVYEALASEEAANPPRTEVTLPHPAEVPPQDPKRDRVLAAMVAGAREIPKRKRLSWINIAYYMKRKPHRNTLLDWRKTYGITMEEIQARL